MSKQIFKDNLTYEANTKSVLCMRDGALEYLGSELGVQPFDKVFKVYRTPATVANVAPDLLNVPITDEHVSLDTEVTKSCGAIKTAKLVDLINDANNSFLAIKNQVTIDNTALSLVDSGKKELSLGYYADLIPCDLEGFDFEQKNIEPHHLAIVNAGRCGSACSFIDRSIVGEVKQMSLHKYFLDEEGNPNLAQIVEIAMQLPEALKTIPVDELQKVLPILQNIIAMASNSDSPEAEAQEQVQDPNNSQDVEASDEDNMQESTPASSDADDQQRQPVQDSAIFKDALKVEVNKAVKLHAEVMTKAKDFLDSDYKYVGKTTKQIMIDAVSTQHNENFNNDEHLEIAFKLLKKPHKVYDSFGPHNDERKKLFDDIFNGEM